MAEALAREAGARKISVARLSILSNSFLILLKVVVGSLSGSVSIVADALHSGADLLAALVAFFTVRQ
ncbi:MAG TPA: cation transporter, partial [Armatimonadota bacterium]